MNTRLAPGWTSAWIAGFVLLLLLSACETSPPQGGRAGATPSVLTPRTLTRLDALPGSLLIVPIDGDWLVDPGVALTGVLDDGRTTTVRFHRVRVEVVPELPGSNARRADWLPAPGVWSSAPARAGDAGADARSGTRVMAIELPPKPGGTTIDVAGRRWAIHWLPLPHEILDLKLGVESESLALWRPTQPPSAAVSPAFAAHARPESLTPIGRWRYRMLTDGLGPPGVGDAGNGPLPPFEDPVIEAIARQNEARWRTALALLWSIDADLAWRLKQRLTLAVDFGSGVVAPAWPTDHAVLDLLLADLLDPALSRTQRARRAAEWLEAQPPAVAWVIDDAGVLDAKRGVGVARVGVANLADRPTLAWAQAEGAREDADLRPAPPGTALALPVVPAEGGARAGGADLVTAHLGKWSQSLRVQARPIPLTPPGLTLGPLAPDLTLNAWLAESRARAATATTATVARLHRPARAAGVSGPRPFELYVECRTPPDAGDPENDAVRVWLGPAGRPTAVLRVTANGRMVNEVEGEGSEGEEIRVHRAPGQWSFRVPIPASCVEADGVLRLGLTRADAGGRRAAAPRALLPWQSEPGRAAIDTRAWSEDER